MTKMHFHGRTACFISLLFTLCGIHAVFCAPTITEPTLLQGGDHGLTINAPTPLNYTASGVPIPPPTSNSTQLKWYETTWKITETLSLEVTISEWQPDPQTIFDVLLAAQTTVGKKVGESLVEEKFVQKSANKYNTLLFEIKPDRIFTGLTWSDVAKVVGEDGLIKFYQATQMWRSIDFDVVDVMRSEIGHGTVRRWWQPGLSSEKGTS